MKPEFVSLHNHTHGSLLDGFGKVGEYIGRAKELGMDAFGISDHGNVFKVNEFLKLAQENDMIGIPGCEMYMAPINPEGARVQKPVFYGANGQKGKYDVSSNGAYLHMTMWAYNEEGLHNLFKLSTMSYAVENNYKKNRIDLDMLIEHNEGLIVATGCPSSEISTRFLLGQDQKAYEYAGRLKDVFGEDRLFVEVMNHGMQIDLERILLPKQLKLAKDMNLKIIATNDSHYTYKTDSIYHEEMLCSQSGSFMSEKTYNEGGNRFAFDGDQYYIKSPEEMSLLFPERDFPGALSNTLLIKEMAQDLKLRFDPTLKPSPGFPKEFHSEEQYFKHLISEGFKIRYGNASPEVKKQAKANINKEFNVLHSSNFIGYFLTNYEYLKFARDNYSTLNDKGEIVALSIGKGRGSVGGSTIAYCLFISEIDPIKHGLIFERFLTPGRGETYRITYDDGSYEDLVVSNEKNIILDNKVEKKYIHQLNIGDVVVDDN